MESVSEHDDLEEKFNTFFSNRGYKKLPIVDITSRIDKTVYLINSATNLFKPFIADKDVRIFVAQPSMRTQILGDYYCEEKETEYPTCFKSFGVYVSLEYIQKLINDCIEFFSLIGLDTGKMRIRASYDDPLLVAVAKSSIIGESVVMDSRTEKYEHQYGSPFCGRAIKLDYYQEWSSKHKNLCYFVLISENGVVKGVEMATSDQLMLMRLNNLKYAISAAKIAKILPTQTFIQRRFADSVVGVSNLIYENVRPNSSNTNGRTMKKYLKAAYSFGRSQNLSLNCIVDVIYDYIQLEHSCEFNKDTISSYLSQQVRNW